MPEPLTETQLGILAYRAKMRDVGLINQVNQLKQSNMALIKNLQNREKENGQGPKVPPGVPQQPAPKV